jgi:molybdopterin-guanine dinucleotide biosynthesis protein A
VLAPDDITGLILAGGRGARMGGVDKGLQTLAGEPLAKLAIERLRPQVGRLAINANRHLETYSGWGVPVWPDGSQSGEFAGPLAGFLTGLAQCKTPYLCTVPCDTPLFPRDLVERLAHGLQEKGADLAMAMAPEGEGKLRSQPVFCLMKLELREDLIRFMAEGGRKIDAWTAGQRTVQVPFSRPEDLEAFININTLQDLQKLQSHRFG